MITSAIINFSLILSIIVSFAGGTLAVASNSLPDEPLYGLKLAIEEVQLDLTRDPAQLAAQHLVLAQNRIQEVIQQAQAGDLPDSGTHTRVEEHFNMALQMAAQLGGEGMLGVLNQANLMLQIQTQELTRTQAQVGEPLQEPLGLVIRMLNRIQERVKAGIQDPDGFRSQYRQGYADCTDCQPLGDQHRYGPESNQPGPGEPGGNPDCQDCDPEGDQHQYGPGPEQPGPGEPGGNPDCQDCDPEGNQHQYGPGPEQPGPGEPGGNPDCIDCDPEGDQHQYGPGPDQPGPGGPGGNPDCQDCDPEGDQHQYGPIPDQPGPGGPGGNPDCIDCDPEGDQNQSGQPAEPPGSKGH